MNLITTNSGRKRQMVYVPDINPTSFLFLFEKGTSGCCFSLRQFSARQVTLRYARELGCTADEIRRRAVHCYDAPCLDVMRVADWHAYTVALNELHGLRDQQSLPALPGAAPPRITTGRYPILNEGAFQRLGKAAKTADVHRMLESAQSEDWVTWNIFQLLFEYEPEWWAHLSKLAAAANPSVDWPAVSAVPGVDFWRNVGTPKSYEALSRERMAGSSDALVAARSREPLPVEGNSEIDVVFEAPSFLVYAEAKLASDISMRTTYDPDRNQIVRNIDCLLEAANGRDCLFCMLVRDISPARAYTQLIGEYRQNPSALCRALSHRDADSARKVASRLALITWRDLAANICTPLEGDEEQVVCVKRELWRRIGG